MDDRLKERLTPIVFCLGGLLLAHHEMILSGFAVTSADLGDTRFTGLIMEHLWRWLLGQQADLWTPTSFYPQTGHMVWNENMLGAGILYVPFRVIGLDPDSAYQAWALATGALNFTATYFLLRRAFGFSAMASSLGAAMFAFSASRINQTMHWQLFPHYWTAWAAHAGYRLAEASKLTERQRVWWISVLAGSMVGQMWACIYLGWFLIFAFAMGLALGLGWTKIRAEVVGLVKGHPYTLALAALLSLACLYPLGWRYLQTAGQFGGRPIDEALTMLPHPMTWFYMGQGSWFWGRIAGWSGFGRIPMEHEQRIGFGLIATAVAAYGFYRFRKEHRLVFVGVLLVGLILITTQYGNDGMTPWRIVHAYFPGAQAVRAVARASILYMLGVAILVASVIDWMGKSEKTATLALPLVAALFFEQGYNTPSFSKKQNIHDIGQVIAAVEPGCEVFVMSPVSGYGPYWKYQLDAMWASLYLGIPTVNGYAGQNPEGWGLGDTNLRSPQHETYVRQQVQGWIQKNPALQSKKMCWARVGFNEGPNFASEFVSQQAPRSIKQGESLPVEVSFKNLGPQPWPMGRGVRLGSEAPQDNSQWGTTRVELQQETPAGATATFRFNITAPQESGPHAFQWRVVIDGVQWVGEMSPMVMIDVQPSAVPELLQAPPEAVDAGS